MFLQLFSYIFYTSNQLANGPVSEARVKLIHWLTELKSVVDFMLKIFEEIF